MVNRRTKEMLSKWHFGKDFHQLQKPEKKQLKKNIQAFARTKSKHPRYAEIKNPFGQITNIAVSGAGAVMAGGIALSIASAFKK
jgi:hypothetical protein